MIRLRAILCSLWFGILPWWLYEEECHYRPWGYWRHLAHNLAYALTWAASRERDFDRWFEREVNIRPRWHRWMRA